MIYLNGNSETTIFFVIQDLIYRKIFAIQFHSFAFIKQQWGDTLLVATQKWSIQLYFQTLIALVNTHI